MVRPLLSQADRADVFRGLAHPARRRVWRALAQGEKTSGQLLEGLAMSQAALSSHLRVMREAGLILPRTVQGQRYYRRSKDAFNRACRWLTQSG